MEQVPGGKGGKFILIVDEADDMFCATERHQVFEQALQKLLGLNPSMASIRFLCMLILWLLGGGAQHVSPLQPNIILFHLMLICLSYSNISDCYGFCNPSSFHARSRQRKLQA